MHPADMLRDRYSRGESSPGEINAIARIYADLKGMTYPQALEDVHDGLGYGMAEDLNDARAGFPWIDVSRSLVPLGRRWISGLPVSD
jgi:hypothetical protein